MQKGALNASENASVVASMMSSSENQAEYCELMYKFKRCRLVLFMVVPCLSGILVGYCVAYSN